MSDLDPFDPERFNVTPEEVESREIEAEISEEEARPADED